MPLHGIEEEEEKPCRACTDFRSWAKKQSKQKPPAVQNDIKIKESSTNHECPLDKDDLGRSTWGFLHTMAAYFPDKPTIEQAQNMCDFFQIFAEHYPCEPCAKDFAEDITKNPPKTKSSQALSQWLCERHNTVNIKLGKPEFDCSKVFERWRDGWADGSCD
ncbi:FAD-linked sulfhydryl oxidase ALR [Eumeta japonica]|uniref:Sulfhydryl oxidase n=1 Tax=Eumeta variegata TaxID=151549 RepID=A0A4C1V4U7_EUMVA|nr:FAD-linked sulfhydryl oxidase ALR [Eumeta japonica]